LRPGLHERVDALVRRAYRRSWLVLGIEYAAIPASLVLAGAALLLLAGTQILDWYWLLILPTAGFAVGCFRVRSRVPNRYGVAQTLDRRLALNDTISTAWFLHQYPELSTTRAASLQLAQAEALAHSIDSASALPIRGGRAWALAALLAALVFGLFCTRYLVRHDLDLRQSLLPNRLNVIGAGVKDAWRAAAKELARMTSRPGRAGDTRNVSAELQEPAGNDAVALNNSTSPGSQAVADPRTSLTPGSYSNAHNAAGRNGSQDGKPGSPATADSKASNSPSQEKPGSSQPKNSTGEPGHGLMNRIKDAMSSLMAKMNSASPSKNSSQASARSAAAPDQDQADSSGDRSQSQTSASQNAQNPPNAASKGDGQGQAVEMPQPAAGQSALSSPQQGGNQSKSGVGKQDGSKSLKSAEELRAMGKLAEIIGKRSQDVTGEAMVDAPSGKQQLRTGYTGEVSRHSDQGGEIDRDEVPLEFQRYVREYMARVHQQASKNE
jgi:hypothetical protein